MQIFSLSLSCTLHHLNIRKNYIIVQLSALCGHQAEELDNTLRTVVHNSQSHIS